MPVFLFETSGYKRIYNHLCYFWHLSQSKLKTRGTKWTGTDYMGFHNNLPKRIAYCSKIKCPGDSRPIGSSPESMFTIMTRWRTNKSETLSKDVFKVWKGETLMFSPSRYGFINCPSEVSNLTFQVFLVMKEFFKFENSGLISVQYCQWDYENVFERLRLSLVFSQPKELHAYWNRSYSMLFCVCRIPGLYEGFSLILKYVHLPA